MAGCRDAFASREPAVSDECRPKSMGPPPPSKEEGPPSPYFSSRGGWGCRDKSTHRSCPEVYFWKALLVYSWNGQSLLDDDRLPCLSNELRKLRVDIVPLSKQWRPGRGQINGEGRDTHHWSGMSNGSCVKGVAMGISSWLLPFVVEVASVHERIM